MAFILLLKTYDILNRTVEIFEPEKEAVMTAYRKGEIPFPYWSQVWPAAIALARFIIIHPGYIQDKKVLELAAGLGLPSVVATSQAASVIASDYVEEAIKIMQQSVKHNNTRNMQVQLLNWYTLPSGLSAEVLLLSDVSYDDAIFELQLKIITGFLEQDTTVIISTPQRLIAKEAIMPLLYFCRHQEEMAVLQNGAIVLITVMVLQKKTLE